MSEHDNLQDADGKKELEATKKSENTTLSEHDKDETCQAESLDDGQLDDAQAKVESNVLHEELPADAESEPTKKEEEKLVAEATPPDDISQSKSDDTLAKEEAKAVEQAKVEEVELPVEAEKVETEPTEKVESEPTEAVEKATTDEVEFSAEAEKDIAETGSSESTESPTETTSKKEDKHVEEIEESNAEDAEDADNEDRHNLEEKDYHAMSMEQLADEFESLLKNRKVQTIKSHVDEIKSEFNSKFTEILEEKKEEFISEGGNEIDFYYSSPVKKRFNSLYKDYRNNLKTYRKNLESNLKANLENRLQIIEDIKGLLNLEENISTTYKQFKDLQEQWRNAGPIPRDKYNNAWNTYHHHVEIFYDFLHLNRDLRDMDFKHNFEQKLVIIERAEELAKDNNINRAFRELQVLHKMWKEDLGPVDKQHREEIWERFSTATKAIHEKRQAYYADMDKAHERNLERKEQIIADIDEIAKDEGNSHQAWQKKIKKIESLRQDFFNAGKVPMKQNEPTWAKFKSAVRTFNRKKNAFYKNLKKDQYDNLQKKLDLIKIAEENKDSKDFETVTPLMKKIQSDWKSIGHVPRKDSDKIWKRFKSACNHYFDQLHDQRKEAEKELFEAFDKKNELLESLKTAELSGKPEKDMEFIKAKMDEWKAIGNVPHSKRYIEGKFNKTLDQMMSGHKIDKSEVEMLKFENKLDNLSQPDDTRLLDNEHNFIRKKIDEVRSEINQLENNLQFFSNVDESNPLVKDVLNNIAAKKDNLSVWEEKLKKIKELY